MHIAQTMCPHSSNQGDSLISCFDKILSISDKSNCPRESREINSDQRGKNLHPLLPNH